MCIFLCWFKVQNSSTNQSKSPNTVFGKLVGSKPNEVLAIVPKFWQYIGYDPNNYSLAKYWSCQSFGWASGGTNQTHPKPFK